MDGEQDFGSSFTALDISGPLRIELEDFKKGKPPYLFREDVTVELIVTNLPESKEELELIYGIGPKIVTDYGKDILALVASHAGAIREGIAKNPFKTPSLPGSLPSLSYSPTQRRTHQVSPSVIKAHPNHFMTWTAEMDSNLVELVATGRFSPKMLARAFGRRSSYAISCRLEELEKYSTFLKGA